MTVFDKGKYISKSINTKLTHMTKTFPFSSGDGGGLLF
jgi:hypothetical protein